MSNDPNVTNFAQPPVRYSQQEERYRTEKAYQAAMDEVERAARAAVPDEPAAPADPTDTEYVANSIDRLRYLDLKKIAAEMIGEAKPDTPAEWADLMAEWAATNKTKV